MDNAVIKQLVDAARELHAEGREELAGPLMESLRAARFGNLDEARQALIPALQQPPSSKYPWLAAMYLADDERGQQQAAEQVLALDPADPDARQRLGAAPPPAPDSDEVQAPPPPTADSAAPPPIPGMAPSIEDANENTDAASPDTPAADAPERRFRGTEEDGSRVFETGTYEMFWDCEFCGSDKLLGKTHRYCPTCGAPQNPEKRYFPAAGEEVAVADHRFVGADRVCENCDTPNAAGAEFCTSCGAGLDEAAEARRISETPPPAEEPEEAPKSRKGLFATIGAGLAALVGGFIFWTEDVSVSVIDHRWEREIQIEAYGPQADSAWCDQMPADAYQVSRRQEIRDHRRVPDGETCSTRRVDQGDGTFRTEEVCETKYREEPIYDDRCSYTVDRWAYARSATAQGNDLNPQWPALSLQGQGRECHGCEREGSRSSRYILALQGEDETFNCTVSESLWQQAQPNSRWTMEVGAMMGEARCGSLAPLH